MGLFGALRHAEPEFPFDYTCPVVSQAGCKRDTAVTISVCSGFIIRQVAWINLGNQPPVDGLYPARTAAFWLDWPKLLVSPMK